MEKCVLRQERVSGMRANPPPNQPKGNPMTARSKPREGYDENPPLDAAFFARAHPATPGEAARLRAALERIIDAHDEGRSLDEAIARARKMLAVVE